MANVTGLSNVPRRRVRVRRGILAGDGRSVCHDALAVVAARLSASARHHDRWIAVIRERCLEGRRGMTGIALHGNARMARRTRIGSCTGRDRPVVTRGATARDVGVIERAVRIEQDETRRGVTVAALLRRNEVICRLAGGDDAIVARAALTEHLRVVDEAHDRECHGRMARLAIVTRRNMRAWLARHCRVRGTRVTLITVAREPAVNERLIN